MMRVTVNGHSGSFHDRHAAAEYLDVHDNGGKITVTGKPQHAFTYAATAAIGAYSDAEYLSLRNRGCPPILAGLVAARRYKRRPIVDIPPTPTMYRD